MTDQPTVTDIRRGLVQLADAYHESAKRHYGAETGSAAFDAWCAQMTAANFANVIAAMLKRAYREFGGDCAARLAEVTVSADDERGDGGETAYFANDDVRMAAEAAQPAKTTQQLARRYGSAADAQNTNTEK